MPITAKARTAQRLGLNRRAMSLSGSSGPWGGPVMGMSSFLPAPVMSGVAVTPETSLTFVAVFAAVNVISTDVASLPLRTLRTLRTGGRVRVPAHPTYNLVYLEPNENTTSMRFRQALMGHVLLWGNGYAEIERLKDGTPAALHPLSPKPNDTWAEKNRHGQMVYQIDGGRRSLLPENVVHIAGLGWDGLSGYSPIALARQAVGLGIAAEQFGASFYGNGSSPRGALQVKKRLTPEGIRNLREGWEAVHQGTVNANRTAILEEGTEWKGIGMSPQDAQFLDSRKFQVVEIARLYRLPPHKLGDYSQAHLANLEASNLDYLATTLGPWVEVWEQQFNSKLFTRRERAHGLHVSHDLTALLRGNMQARADYYQRRFMMGSISPDEIREREGDNPIGGPASKTYVQMQLVPLGTEPKAAITEPGAESTNVETPDDQTPATPKDTPPAEAENTP